MKSISHTKSFQMDIPIEELFPLFTPEGEKKWAPGWDYINLMETIELSEDYVFITKTHDHKTTEAIWIVKKFDPKSYIDEYFEHFIQKKAGESMDKMMEIIKRHMGG